MKSAERVATDSPTAHDKTAATIIGVSIDEFMRERAAGNKWSVKQTSCAECEMKGSAEACEPLFTRLASLRDPQTERERPAPQTCQHPPELQMCSCVLKAIEAELDEAKIRLASLTPNDGVTGRPTVLNAYGRQCYDAGRESALASLRDPREGRPPADPLLGENVSDPWDFKR